MATNHATFEEDQATSSPIEEFISHYQQEMCRRISHVQECIQKLKQEPDKQSLYQEIEKDGLAISDLAMVYGYEGVEVIGNRIAEAVTKRRDEFEQEKLLSRLEEATRAIEEAMLLIDERKERELIREISFSSSRNEDSDREKEEEEKKGEPSDSLFDIREDEKLISLLNDVNGQAVEIEQYEQPENPIETIDVDSILGEHYSPLDFDIPESSDAESEEEIIEDDILDLDLKPGKKISAKENNEGLFRKIGQFFGIKGKNRISLQE